MLTRRAVLTKSVVLLYSRQTDPVLPYCAGANPVGLRTGRPGVHAVLHALQPQRWAVRRRGGRGSMPALHHTGRVALIAGCLQGRLAGLAGKADWVNCRQTGLKACVALPRWWLNGLARMLCCTRSPPERRGRLQEEVGEGDPERVAGGPDMPKVCRSCDNPGGCHVS